MTDTGGARHDAVMVRYGEIFLKSEPVKRRFIGQLAKNIIAALDARGLTHALEIHRGRIVISGDDAEAIAAVACRIFGVVDASVCTSTTPTREGLSEAAVALAVRHLRTGQSFAIRARRQGIEDFSSQELGALVGEAVLDAVPGVSVDLTCPDYEIYVEAREYGGFVCDRRLPAPGGLPWSTQGRVLGLISGGIDSPVASWLLMRRGCEMVHLYLDGGCWVGGDRRGVVESHHQLLSTWCMGYPLELLVANSEPFYDAVARRTEARYRCVLCKRFMLRVAGHLAESTGALAVATGDNLGQVASQTLVNMAVISEASTLPVLRPLVSYDKAEIVELARKVGTFDQTHGDLCCRAVPRYPSTAAVLETVHRLEESIGAVDIAREVARDTERFVAKNGELQAFS